MEIKEKKYSDNMCIMLVFWARFSGPNQGRLSATLYQVLGWNKSCLSKGQANIAWFTSNKRFVSNQVEWVLTLIVFIKVQRRTTKLWWISLDFECVNWLTLFNCIFRFVLGLCWVRLDNLKRCLAYYVIRIHGRLIETLSKRPSK